LFYLKKIIRIAMHSTINTNLRLTGVTLVYASTTVAQLESENYLHRITHSAIEKHNIYARAGIFTLLFSDIFGYKKKRTRDRYLASSSLQVYLNFFFTLHCLCGLFFKKEWVLSFFLNIFFGLKWTGFWYFRWIAYF